jgi:hypothetical protein
LNVSSTLNHLSIPQVQQFGAYSKLARDGAFAENSEVVEMLRAISEFECFDSLEDLE